METRRRDERSRELLQGQLEIVDVIVARKLSRDQSTIIYKFPLSFELHISKAGVSLAGTSSILNVASAKQMRRILTWAIKCSNELAAGRGAIPQNELEGKIKLKRRVTTNGWRAWYEGKSSQAIERKTENEAVASLRSIYNQLNEKH